MISDDGRLSGIQKHVVAAVGLGALALTMDKWRTQYFAEKDATLRHYVELHPEDFPTPGMYETRQHEYYERVGSS